MSFDSLGTANKTSDDQKPVEQEVKQTKPVPVWVSEIPEKEPHRSYFESLTTEEKREYHRMTPTRREYFAQAHARRLKKPSSNT